MSLKKLELESVLDYIQPTPYIVKSTQYNDDFSTPVLTPGESFLLGYTDEEDGIFPASIDNPIILFDDFTTSIKWVDFPFKVKSSACKILVPKSEVNLKYIYYAMKHLDFDSRQHKRYWISEYSKLTIPFSEKSDEIVKVLDNINEEIEHEQEQLIVMDEMISSRFNELFGSRITNPYKWPQKKIRECMDFFNGKAHENFVDEDGEYILVTSKCISTNFMNYRRTAKQLFPLKIDDIVMVMSDVPNGKAYARCWLIDSNDLYTLNQRICCLRNYYDFEPVFLRELLNRHEYFLQFDDGQNQTNLRKDDLLNCTLIIPPLNLQKDFVKFVNLIEENKIIIKKRIELYKELFNKKMDEYFK